LLFALHAGSFSRGVDHFVELVLVDGSGLRSLGILAPGLEALDAVTDSL